MEASLSLVSRRPRSGRAEGVPLALLLAAHRPIAFTVSSVVVASVETHRRRALGGRDRPPSQVPGTRRAQPSSRWPETQIGSALRLGRSQPRDELRLLGLVQWAYGQVGVRLPRTAQEQYDADDSASTRRLQPGDLVFFAQTYPSASRSPTSASTSAAADDQRSDRGGRRPEMPVFTGFCGAHYAAREGSEVQMMPDRRALRHTSVGSTIAFAHSRHD